MNGPLEQNSPNLLSPWLKCPRTSPATRTCARALQCWAGVPTAVIHRSTKDSTSYTATHLCWSKHLPVVCKWRILPARRLHKKLALLDRPAILEFWRSLQMGDWWRTGNYSVTTAWRDRVHHRDTYDDWNTFCENKDLADFSIKNMTIWTKFASKGPQYYLL